MRKIDLMEVGISIARLFRLAFQNYQVILSSFFLGLILAFGYTASPLMDPGTYVATGAVAHANNSNAIILNTIVEAVTTNGLADEVALNLATDEVTLPNGSPVTSALIKANTTAVTVPNSLRINITFTYPDADFAVLVVNEIIETSITYANTNYPVLGNGVIFAENALTATFDGPSTTLYLAIGALLGLMIGGAVGVLWDAFKGTVYSAQDLKEFGLSSFFLNLKIVRPFTKETLLRWIGLDSSIAFEKEQTKLITLGLVPSPSFTTIQNNLESTRPQPQDPLTTLMVSPTPNASLSMVAFAYARQSSTQGRKTLLIDFDLKDIPFTKYLEKYKLETRKKASSKEGLSFLSLEENLDLYLPLQDVIPAKFIRDQSTQDTLTQVKKKYDHIIILGPSLLPDAAVLSMVQYANSALVVGMASITTTTQMIKSINTLIDANVQAIETLIVNETIKTDWSTFISNLKAGISKKVAKPSKPKTSKKK
ncbi:MAG: hypothetical protein ACO3BB_02035 [Bacilli bacterium]